jgi:hypothetical protein
VPDFTRRVLAERAAAAAALSAAPRPAPPPTVARALAFLALSGSDFSSTEQPSGWLEAVATAFEHIRGWGPLAMLTLSRLPSGPAPTRLPCGFEWPAPHLPSSRATCQQQLKLAPFSLAWGRVLGSGGRSK